MSYEIYIFEGNVGKEPEMRYTPSGQAVVNFSVAVNNEYTNSQTGEKVKDTKWIRVQAWGKLAEVCNQYVKKGNAVLVEGKLVSDKSNGGPRVWTKADGSSAASFEVNASVVRFLGGKSEGKSNFEPAVPDIGDGEDMPF